MKSEKIKRPDKKLYVPPALRSCDNKDCENMMQFFRSYSSSEGADSIGNSDSYLTRTNIVRRRMESDYSSYNSKIESYKSGEDDDDSSDFEDSSIASNELTDDQEIIGIMGTNQVNSNHHWNAQGIGKSSTNNHIKNTLKSRSNMMRNSGSNEKCHRGVFFNYDDLSDMETFDCKLTKGRILTSTPNSDIDDQEVLDAAKYVPEEDSGMESTLLDESDIEITIHSNINKCGYNAKISHDTSSVTSQLKELSESFKNTYISPPVPPLSSVFQLPPIHRLPSPVSASRGLSIHRLESSQVSSQMQPLLRHPRLQFPPSLQSHSSLQSPSPNPSNSPRMPIDPRYAFSLRWRSASPIPPPHPRKQRSNPEPTLQGDSSSLHFHPQRPSSQSLKSNKGNGSSYIPPPLSPPRQIRNLNQLQNVQSRQPNSISMAKILYDEKSCQNC